MSRSLLSKFITGDYTVRRFGEGFYDRGIYQKGEEETISMKGSLQPVTAREIKQSTDGERLTYDFKFYSFEPLLTINTTTLNQSDKVVINDETFRVMGFEEWSNQVGFGGVDLPHFKTKLLREPQQ